MIRSSFSQHQKFSVCPRLWFYKYILKTEAPEDLTYANSGKVVHEILESYYNGNGDRTRLKELFNSKWKGYSLHESRLKLQEDAYWNMVLNALDLCIPLTSVEFKIYYPDALAFLDGIDTNNKEIIDWKSGAPQPYHRQQLLLYSWLYKRHFGHIPAKATVYYLTSKDNHTTITPTEGDIADIAAWYQSILNAMEQIAKEGKLPPKCAGECDPYCPYTEICKPKEDIMQFNLILSGTYIYINNIIPELLNKGLERKFSYELKNAIFIKKHYPQADTTIHFWNLKHRRLPIGFYHGLMKTLTDFAEYNKKKADIFVEDRRYFNPMQIGNLPSTFLNHIELRPYQKEAVEKMLEKKIGILKMSTGTGKTEILIEIIRRLNMPTLFLCEKVDLMRQTKQRIEEALGLPVGIIGASEFHPDFITISTMQTLSRHAKENAEWLKGIRVLIIDEAHHSSARSYVTIGRYLPNTEYRIGATATPERDDGDTLAVYSMIGYPEYETNIQNMIKDGWLMRPEIYFIRGFTTEAQQLHSKLASHEGFINETETYPKLYSAHITHNEDRNNLIKTIVENNPGKRILILCKLIEHEILLHELIPNAKHLYGGTDKNTRIEIIKSFKNENFALISTMSIFSEGLDIKELDILINASGNAGSVKTIQSLGRILRPLKDKALPKYYDFIDDHRLFKRASYTRRRAFMKQEHTVKIISKDEVQP